MISQAARDSLSMKPVPTILLHFGFLEPRGMRSATGEELGGRDDAGPSWVLDVGTSNHHLTMHGTIVSCVRVKGWTIAAVCMNLGATRY